MWANPGGADVRESWRRCGRILRAAFAAVLRSTHPLPSPVLPQASLRVRIAKTPVHPDVRGVGARLADVRCRVAEASASDSEPSGSLSYSTSESGPGADVTVAGVRLSSPGVDVASSAAAFCHPPAPLLEGEWR